MNSTLSNDENLNNNQQTTIDTQTSNVELSQQNVSGPPQEDPAKNKDKQQSSKSDIQLQPDYSYLEKHDIPKTVKEASDRLKNIFNYAIGVHRLEEGDIKNIIDVYNNGLKTGDPRYDEKMLSVKKAFELDNSGFLYNAIGKVSNYQFDFSNPDKVRSEYDGLIKTLIKYKVDPEAVKQYNDIKNATTDITLKKGLYEPSSQKTLSDEVASYGVDIKTKKQNIITDIDKDKQNLQDVKSKLVNNKSQVDALYNNKKIDQKNYDDYSNLHGKIIGNLDKMSESQDKIKNILSNPNFENDKTLVEEYNKEIQYLSNLNKETQKHINELNKVKVPQVIEQKSIIDKEALKKWTGDVSKYVGSIKKTLGEAKQNGKITSEEYSNYVTKLDNINKKLNVDSILNTKGIDVNKYADNVVKELNSTVGEIQKKGISLDPTYNKLSEMQDITNMLGNYLSVYYNANNIKGIFDFNKQSDLIRRYKSVMDDGLRNKLVNVKDKNSISNIVGDFEKSILKLSKNIAGPVINTTEQLKAAKTYLVAPQDTPNKNNYEVLDNIENVVKSTIVSELQKSSFIKNYHIEGNLDENKIYNVYNVALSDIFNKIRTTEDSIVKLEEQYKRTTDENQKKEISNKIQELSKELSKFINSKYTYKYVDKYNKDENGNPFYYNVEFSSPYDLVMIQKGALEQIRKQFSEGFAKTVLEDNIVEFNNKVVEMNETFKKLYNQYGKKIEEGVKIYGDEAVRTLLTYKEDLKNIQDNHLNLENVKKGISKAIYDINIWVNPYVNNSVLGLSTLHEFNKDLKSIEVKHQILQNALLRLKGKDYTEEDVRNAIKNATLSFLKSSYGLESFKNLSVFVPILKRDKDLGILNFLYPATDMFVDYFGGMIGAIANVGANLFQAVAGRELKPVTPEGSVFSSMFIDNTLGMLPIESLQSRTERQFVTASMLASLDKIEGTDFIDEPSLYNLYNGLQTSNANLLGGIAGSYIGGLGVISSVKLLSGLAKVSNVSSKLSKIASSAKFLNISRAKGVSDAVATANRYKNSTSLLGKINNYVGFETLTYLNDVRKGLKPFQGAVLESVIGMDAYRILGNFSEAYMEARHTRKETEENINKWLENNSFIENLSEEQIKQYGLEDVRRAYNNVKNNKEKFVSDAFNTSLWGNMLVLSLIEAPMDKMVSKAVIGKTGFTLPLKYNKSTSRIEKLKMVGDGSLYTFSKDLLRGNLKIPGRVLRESAETLASGVMEGTTELLQDIVNEYAKTIDPLHPENPLFSEARASKMWYNLDKEAEEEMFWEVLLSSLLIGGASKMIEMNSEYKVYLENRRKVAQLLSLQNKLFGKEGKVDLFKMAFNPYASDILKTQLNPNVVHSNLIDDNSLETYKDMLDYLKLLNELGLAKPYLSMLESNKRDLSTYFASVGDGTASDKVYTEFVNYLHNKGLISDEDKNKLTTDISKNKESLSEVYKTLLTTLDSFHDVANNYYVNLSNSVKRSIDLMREKYKDDPDALEVLDELDKSLMDKEFENSYRQRLNKASNMSLLLDKISSIANFKSLLTNMLTDNGKVKGGVEMYKYGDTYYMKSDNGIWYELQDGKLNVVNENNVVKVQKVKDEDVIGTIDKMVLDYKNKYSLFVEKIKNIKKEINNIKADKELDDKTKQEKVKTLENELRETIKSLRMLRPSDTDMKQFKKDLIEGKHDVILNDMQSDIKKEYENDSATIEDVKKDVKESEKVEMMSMMIEELNTKTEFAHFNDMIIKKLDDEIRIIEGMLSNFNIEIDNNKANIKEFLNDGKKYKSILMLYKLKQIVNKIKNNTENEDKRKELESIIKEIDNNAKNVLRQAEFNVDEYIKSIKNKLDKSSIEEIKQYKSKLDRFYSKYTDVLSQDKLNENPYKKHLNSVSTRYDTDLADLNLVKMLVFRVLDVLVNNKFEINSEIKTYEDFVKLITEELKTLFYKETNDEELANFKANTLVKLLNKDQSLKLLYRKINDSMFVLTNNNNESLIESTRDELAINIHRFLTYSILYLLKVENNNFDINDEESIKYIDGVISRISAKLSNLIVDVFTSENVKKYINIDFDKNEFDKELSLIEDISKEISNKISKAIDEDLINDLGNLGVLVKFFKDNERINDENLPVIISNISKLLDDKSFKKFKENVKESITFMFDDMLKLDIMDSGLLFTYLTNGLNFKYKVKDAQIDVDEFVKVLTTYDTYVKHTITKGHVDGLNISDKDKKVMNKSYGDAVLIKTLDLNKKFENEITQKPQVVFHGERQEIKKEDKKDVEKPKSEEGIVKDHAINFINYFNVLGIPNRQMFDDLFEKYVSLFEDEEVKMKLLNLKEKIYEKLKNVKSVNVFQSEVHRKAIELFNQTVENQNGEEVFYVQDKSSKKEIELDKVQVFGNSIHKRRKILLRVVFKGSDPNKLAVLDVLNNYYGIAVHSSDVNATQFDMLLYSRNKGLMLVDDANSTSEKARLDSAYLNSGDADNGLYVGDVSNEIYNGVLILEDDMDLSKLLDILKTNSNVIIPESLFNKYEEQLKEYKNKITTFKDIDNLFNSKVKNKLFKGFKKTKLNSILYDEETRKKIGSYYLKVMSETNNIKSKISEAEKRLKEIQDKINRETNSKKKSLLLRDKEKIENEIIRLKEGLLILKQELLREGLNSEHLEEDLRLRTQIELAKLKSLLGDKLFTSLKDFLFGDDNLVDSVLVSLINYTYGQYNEEFTFEHVKRLVNSLLNKTNEELRKEGIPTLSDILGNIILSVDINTTIGKVRIPFISYYVADEVLKEITLKGYERLTNEQILKVFEDVSNDIAMQFNQWLQSKDARIEDILITLLEIKDEVIKNVDTYIDKVARPNIEEKKEEDTKQETETRVEDLTNEKSKEKIDEDINNLLMELNNQNLSEDDRIRILNSINYLHKEKEGLLSERTVSGKTIRQELEEKLKKLYDIIQVEYIDDLDSYVKNLLAAADKEGIDPFVLFQIDGALAENIVSFVISKMNDKDFENNRYFVELKDKSKGDVKVIREELHKDLSVIYENIVKPIVKELYGELSEIQKEELRKKLSAIDKNKMLKILVNKYNKELIDRMSEENKDKLLKSLIEKYNVKLDEKEVKKDKNKVLVELIKKHKVDLSEQMGEEEKNNFFNEFFEKNVEEQYFYSHEKPIKDKERRATQALFWWFVNGGVRYQEVDGKIEVEDYDKYKEGVKVLNEKNIDPVRYAKPEKFISGKLIVEQRLKKVLKLDYVKVVDEREVDGKIYTVVQLDYDHESIEKVQIKKRFKGFTDDQLRKAYAYREFMDVAVGKSFKNWCTCYIDDSGNITKNTVHSFLNYNSKHPVAHVFVDGKLKYVFQDEYTSLNLENEEEKITINKKAEVIEKITKGDYEILIYPNKKTTTYYGFDYKINKLVEKEEVIFNGSDLKTKIRYNIERILPNNQDFKEVADEFDYYFFGNFSLRDKKTNKTLHLVDIDRYDPALIFKTENNQYKYVAFREISESEEIEENNSYKLSIVKNKYIKFLGYYFRDENEEYDGDTIKMINVKDLLEIADHLFSDNEFYVDEDLNYVVDNINIGGSENSTNIPEYQYIGGSLYNRKTNIYLGGKIKQIIVVFDFINKKLERYILNTKRSFYVKDVDLEQDGEVFKIRISERYINEMNPDKDTLVISDILSHLKKELRFTMSDEKADLLRKLHIEYDEKQGIYYIDSDKVINYVNEYIKEKYEEFKNKQEELRRIQFQEKEGRVIGAAHLEAAKILIDKAYANDDTLPHEYAHFYIRWFYDTSIVQEAIRQFGGEEELVRSIGEQAVKQQGEAWTWWKKFAKVILEFIRNLISTNKVDKDTLLKVLTDMFLQRIDLETGEELTTERMKELQQRIIEKIQQNRSKEIIESELKDPADIDKVEQKNEAEKGQLVKQDETEQVPYVAISENNNVKPKNYVAPGQGKKYDLSIELSGDKQIYENVELDFNLDPTIKSILEEMHKDGNNFIIVGGAVRDKLFGVNPKDLDIEVYGHTTKQLVDRLRNYGVVELVGESFGVFKFWTIDMLHKKADNFDFKNVKPSIIVPIGISGSGKSTYVNELREKLGDKLVVISPDEIRVELSGDINDQSKNAKVFEIAKERIIKVIKEGKVVYFDATNVDTVLRNKYFAKIYNELADQGINIDLYYKVFEANIDESDKRIREQIEKGENRANITRDILEKQYNKYVETVNVLNKYEKEIKEPYDFTLPRKEEKVGVGYKGFKIDVDPNLPIEKASERRDFTFNSMGYNPITKTLYDHFYGIKDMKEGVIRHVNDRTFVEDPLRILRAMQFQGRYGMVVAENTLQLIRKLALEVLPSMVVNKIHTLPEKELEGLDIFLGDDEYDKKLSKEKIEELENAYGPIGGIGYILEELKDKFKTIDENIYNKLQKAIDNYYNEYRFITSHFLEEMIDVYKKSKVRDEKIDKYLSILSNKMKRFKEVIANNREHNKRSISKGRKDFRYDAFDFKTEVHALSPERVWVEFEKWASKSKYHNLMLDFIYNSGLAGDVSTANAEDMDFLIRGFFYEFGRLKLTPQDKIWHPEGDVMEHTMQVIAKMSEVIERESQKIKELAKASKTFTEKDINVLLYLSALLHDIAKPNTTKKYIDDRGMERIGARGHEEEGAKMLPLVRTYKDEFGSIADRMGIPSKYVDVLIPLVRDHLAHAGLENTLNTYKYSEYEKLLNKVRKDIFFETGIAENNFGSIIKEILKILSKVPVEDMRDKDKIKQALEESYKENVSYLSKKLNVNEDTLKVIGERIIGKIYSVDFSEEDMHRSLRGIFNTIMSKLGKNEEDMIFNGWLLLYLMESDVMGRNNSNEELPKSIKLFRTMLEQFEKESKQKSMFKDLLSGDDIISLGFEKGKIIGDIKKDLKEKQIKGKITTTEEAIKYVKSKYADKLKKQEVPVIKPENEQTVKKEQITEQIKEEPVKEIVEVKPEVKEEPKQEEVKEQPTKEETENIVSKSKKFRFKQSETKNKEC